MKFKCDRSIIIWLLIVCIMIFTMVIIGGITRLTDSGLSMVEWKPILGAIPPMNEVEWNRVFDLYKNYPEYQKVNSGMTLSEFKFIFFWETSTLLRKKSPRFWIMIFIFLSLSMAIQKLLVLE